MNEIIGDNYKDFRKYLIENDILVYRFNKFWYISFLIVSIIFISFNVDIIKYELYCHILFITIGFSIASFTTDLKYIFIYNNLKKDNKSIISLWKYIKFRYNDEALKFFYSINLSIITIYTLLLFYFIMHNLSPLFTDTIFYNYFNFFSYCYKILLFFTNYIAIIIVIFILISIEVFSFIKYENYKKEL